jgi:S1-C subfamily serine protease
MAIANFRSIARAGAALLLPLVLALGIRDAGAQPPAGAEALYAAARPRLLQIRTLVTSAGRQASIGSGFLVSADGLALTNYHVVSQFALEPKTYRLEYEAADGGKGGLQLLAIDIANDLAVLRLDAGARPFFELDPRAVAGELPKGERIYSMGNPLDLGFTIVEGTYNGLVEHSYNERIHFSGALNPGMSGGPAVDAEGKIVGVNVARQLGSDLVSFLVPARFVAALLDRVGASETPSQDMRAEVGRQLLRWQDALYGGMLSAGFRADAFGPYRAPESAASWFRCWGHTNADQVPKPRAAVNGTNCSSGAQLFVAQDLNTGRIELSHSYLRSDELNEFQFAAFLSQQYFPAAFGGWSRKWQTQQRCHDDFLTVADPAEHPVLRAVWCARAYREFPGLYDVWVTAVTQDSTSEALVSRLSLQGISYDNAVALTRRFLAEVQWKR